MENLLSQSLKLSHTHAHTYTSLSWTKMNTFKPLGWRLWHLKCNLTPFEIKLRCPQEFCCKALILDITVDTVSQGQQLQVEQTCLCNNSVWKQHLLFERAAKDFIVFCSLQLMGAVCCVFSPVPSCLFLHSGSLSSMAGGDTSSPPEQQKKKPTYLFYSRQNWKQNTKIHTGLTLLMHI